LTDKQKRPPPADNSSRRLLGRIWRDYLRHHKGKLTAAVVCMVVVAAMTGAQASLVEPALDRLLVSGDAAVLWLLPLAFVAVIVAKALAIYGQAVLMQKTTLRIIEEIQREMFGRLVGADLAYIDGRATGQLIARFLSDARMLGLTLTEPFTALIRDSLTAAFLIGVMFFQNWRLALATFIVFPISATLVVKLGRRTRRAARSAQAETGALTGFLDDVLKGIRQVKAYAMERYEQDRAGAMFASLFGLAFKIAKIQARAAPTLEALGGFVFAAILAYGGYQVTQGQATVGSFMAFFVAMLLAYQPMRRLANVNTRMQQGLAAAERVFEIVDYRSEIADRPDARPLSGNDHGVRLEAVDFSYGEDIPALHGVSLEAPAGRMTALVGPSGAGKSTVLNLIPRFYDVDGGAVTVGGRDVRDVTLDSLRASIALVTQETGLFNDTVGNNIAYGRPDATDEEIREAARNAAADEFIARLPDGYNTMVGERGVFLSGGQRQRISIARAMLKNAPILLLDEATSALDTESEQQVQAALERLMEGRTTIVIAHRLSTVVGADTIYVFDKGRIVESGTHAGLAAAGGLYARLSELQFREGAAAEAEG
jgi:subfamily B ATP-binding cassette protein MsbA